MDYTEKTGLIYLNRSHSHFENLSPQERLWIARVLVGSVCSDKEIKKEELVYIAKAIDFLDSNEEKIKLVEMVRSKKIPALPKLKNIDSKVALDLLFGSAHLIAADKEVKSSELLFFKEASKNLGFKRDYVESVIKWTINLAKIKRLEEKLRLEGPKQHSPL
jgi:uncharacterized tellurite resistance protein B-like protein